MKVLATLIVTTSALLAAPASGAPLNGISAVEDLSGDYLTSRRMVTVDGRSAVLYRRAKREDQVGGEHYSRLETETGQLLGLMRMDRELVSDQLLDRDEALRLAQKFLSLNATDLLASRELHFVAPHTETFDVGGVTVDITGMKVKMRNTNDGLWFWVVLAATGEVITFERDIHWITRPGHRGTEMWLHDSWVANR